MIEQKGDEPIIPFSFENEDRIYRWIRFHVIYYIQMNIHKIVRDNSIGRPYGGVIEGIGPRYCPLKIK